MKTIKIAEASSEQADWLMNMSKGHEFRYPWMLEEQGYSAWLHAEQAWGRPGVLYSGDIFATMSLAWAAKISVIYNETHNGKDNWRATTGLDIHEESGSFVRMELDEAGYPTAKLANGQVDVYADNPMEAALRCLLVLHYGETAEVPEKLP